MAKVSTTLGEMDEALLEKREFAIDNEVERTAIVEYWHGGDKNCRHPKSKWIRHPGDLDIFDCGICGAAQVHRSVSMILKKPAVFADGVAADLPK